MSSPLVPLAYLAFAALLGGCALNGKSLIGDAAPRYLENQAGTGRAVTIDVSGVNVSTIPGDGGITVGRTRRTYYFAGPNSPATPPVNGVREHLSGEGGRFRLAATRPFDFALSRPLAVRGRNDGVAVRTSHGVGVTVGVQAFEAIRIPANANVLMTIQSGAAAGDGFQLKEFRP